MTRCNVWLVCDISLTCDIWMLCDTSLTCDIWLARDISLSWGEPGVQRRPWSLSLRGGQKLLTNSYGGAQSKSYGGALRHKSQQKCNSCYT
jgi:hypothetical protein